MLFRGLTPTEAAAKLDDAREALADRRLINRKTDEPFGQITFSGGVADVLGYGDPSAALKAADEALYKSKAAGRTLLRVTDWAELSIPARGRGGARSAKMVGWKELVRSV